MPCDGGGGNLVHGLVHVNTVTKFTVTSGVTYAGAQRSYPTTQYTGLPVYSLTLTTEKKNRTRTPSLIHELGDAMGKLNTRR
jgi:hypothetical protein